MNKIVTILTTGLLFVATSVFSQLTFTVSPQPITGNVGDMVTLDVSVTDFTNVVSAQFSLAYDPSILQYVTVGDPDMVPGFSVGSFNNNDTNGTLGYTWLDPNVSGLDLADGTRFFTATFEIISPVGADTRLIFSNSPVPLEVTDGSGSEIRLADGDLFFDDGTTGGGIGSTDTGGTNSTTTGGTSTGGGTNTGGTNTGGTTTGGTNTGGTTTGGTNTGGTTTGTTTGGGTTNGTTTGGTSTGSTDFTLIASAETGNVGETVCVQVSTENFEDIVSMQYSMNWDPTRLQYVGAQNFGNGIMSTANFSDPCSSGTCTGDIIVSWDDPTTQGVTTADGTILYELCFEVLAAGTNMVSFSNSPRSIEIIGGDSQEELTLNPISGSVSPPVGAPITGFAAIGSSEVGEVGDEVCVKVSTQDFTDIISMQYGITFDNTVLQFERVQGFNLAGLDMNMFNSPNPGELRFAWLDPTIAGITLPDGTIIYEICFTILSAGQTSVNFTALSNHPTEVTDTAGEEIPFNSSAGTVSQSTGNTTGGDTNGNTTGGDTNGNTTGGDTNGNTTGGNTNGDTDCTVTAASFALLGSAAEGNVGDIVCVEIRGQNFTDIVGMQYSMNWDDTALRYDMAQNFGLVGLSSSSFNNNPTDALRILWSDPDGTGKTVADGVILYEICFEVLSEGSQEISFSGSPTPIEITNNSFQILPFESCPASISQPTGGGDPTTLALIAANQSGQQGANICIPISVDGFEDIVSLQYSMAWDPTVLTYTGVQNFDLDGLMAANFNSSMAGSLGLTWVDPNVSGITRANGTVIYEVCFDVNPNAAANSMTSVAFTDSPVSIEIINGANQMVPTSNTASTFTITEAPNTTAVSGAGDNISGDPGTTVCMPIRVNDFDNIIGLQFSLNWDPAVVQYVEARNFGLTGVNDASFGEGQTDAGTLTFNWIDMSLDGVTLVDGTSIFDVCFQVIGGAGTSTNISFTNTPTQTEVIRGNGVGAVAFNPTGGSLSVNTVMPPACSSISLIQQSFTSSTCNGFNNGTITLTLGGGDGAFTYTWSDPTIGNTSSPTGLAPGTYSVTISSCGGQEVLDNLPAFNITEPSAIQASVQTREASCDTGGSISVSASGGAGGYIYAWNSNALIPASGPVNVPAGTYTLTVTDSDGCSTVVPNVVVSSMSGVSSIQASAQVIDASCNSEARIIVSASGGSGNYEYRWNSSAVLPVNAPVNPPPGTYTLTVTDAGGCSTIVPNVAVATPAVALLRLTADTEPSDCGEPGRIIPRPSGGDGIYTFTWSDPSLMPPNAPTNAAAGTYSLTVTDGSGCAQVLNNIVVAQSNSAGLAIQQSVTPATCTGRADGQVELTLNGTLAGLVCDWGGNGIFGCSPTNVPAGTYVVNINNGTGSCDTPINVVVGNAKVLSGTARPTADICASSDGRIEVIVNGATAPLFFSWVGSQSIPNEQNPAGLSSGTYNVTVSDADACTVAFNDIIVDGIDAPLSITPTAQNNTECLDDPTGSIAVTVEGGTMGYAYNWERADGTPVPGGNGPIITGLSPAVYGLTVTDVNGCTRAQSYTIGANSMLEATVSVTGLAPNATATVTATGGREPYTYIWCNGQSSPTATNLQAGTCNVMVLDALNCAAVLQFDVGVPELSVGITLSTGISCPGANDAVLQAESNGGGTLPYRYNWSNGATSQVIVNAIPGEYTVTITDNANRMATATFNLMEPTPIQINSNNIVSDCMNDGEIQVNLTGGTAPYRIAWSTGEENQTEIDSLRVGEYGIIVTDFNDCTASNSFIVPSDPQCRPCYEAIPIITPDDDGRNDAFRIDCANIAKGNTLQIFNRWGQLVYAAEGYSCVLGTEADCWKGTNQSNRDLPKGGYFWVFEFDDAQGERQRIRNHVTILRE